MLQEKVYNQVKNKKYFYFLGIGGAGMSALASYFISQKKKVLGYDKNVSSYTKRLQKEGASIGFVEEEELFRIKKLNLKEVLFIYTPAIKMDNSVMCFLISCKVELYQRAEILGLISQNYFTIAVAGTHGKTTITSILTHILVSMGVEVVSFSGGEMINFKSNFYISDNPEFMVVEADEYNRSFLSLSFDIAILTSIDPDHLDIYKKPDHVVDSFRTFIEGIKSSGSLLAPAKVLDSLNLKKNLTTYSYGFNDSEVDNKFKITDYEFDENVQRFGFNESQEKFELKMRGKHNALNTLSAISVIKLLNKFDIKLLQKGVSTFKGVWRRFEHHLKDPVVYIDDYAHHPKEIETVIHSVKKIYQNKKITIIFQPHLFSRTLDFYKDFAVALSKANEVILLPIYPARELPIEGVNSCLIYNYLAIKNKHLFSENSTLEYIRNNRSNIDILLSLGAGDISSMVKKIKLCLVD